VIVENAVAGCRLLDENCTVAERIAAFASPVMRRGVTHAANNGSRGCGAISSARSWRWLPAATLTGRGFKLTVGHAPFASHLRTQANARTRPFRASVARFPQRCSR
jgi:hypothetical protein